MRRGWNFFFMEMFLRALYVNPNRSTDELQNLLGSLTPPMIAAEIMRYCYNDLPSHYKSCLLYLSILFKRMYEESSSTQDFKVKRTSIVRRWAAEDLISKRDDRVATDEAERCFDDLVVRGLVCPVDIGAAGRVKSCIVHHRVLSFITKVARDEGLVEDDKDLPPDLACRLSIRNGISLEKRQPQLPKKNNLWVVAQQSTACCKPLPTSIELQESPMDSEDSKHYAEVDKIQEFLESLPTSYPLELVKVLDLEGFKQLKRHHLKDVCNKMFHLKYLSIRDTDVSELPSDIEKLRYLETLDIRQTRIRAFTTKAIVLPKLVHLLAGGYVQKSGDGRSFLTVRLPREIGSMVDLQILYHVVSKSADELMEVGRLQQLRKLGVVLHGREVRLSHFLRVIERLNECLRSLSVKFELVNSETPDLNMGNMAFSPPKLLESLNINGNITGLPSWVKDLRQLVKVTLCGTSLMNNAIRMLGGLSSLRCLRLLHKSYIEMRLTFMDGEFPNLKYLIVEGSVITTIHFRNGAAPKLEKIVWAFEKMVSLSGIKGLPCLKEIELNGNCDPCKIIEALAEHRNHPVVIHKAVNETLVP
jgi:disease resistance protein RPM1